MARTWTPEDRWCMPAGDKTRGCWVTWNDSGLPWTAHSMLNLTWTSGRKRKNESERAKTCTHPSFQRTSEFEAPSFPLPPYQKKKKTCCDLTVRKMARIKLHLSVKIEAHKVQCVWGVWMDSGLGNERQGVNIGMMLEPNIIRCYIPPHDGKYWIVMVIDGGRSNMWQILRLTRHISSTFLVSKVFKMDLTVWRTLFALRCQAIALSFVIYGSTH